MTPDRLLDVGIADLECFRNRWAIANRLGVCADTIRNWTRKGWLSIVLLPSGELGVDRSTIIRLQTNTPVIVDQSRALKTVAKRPAVVCGVYFIQCGEFTKIGYASDVQGRYAELKRANPHETRLVLIVEHETALAARAHEQHLHRYFAKSRHRYEWFRTAPDISAYVTSKTCGQLR